MTETLICPMTGTKLEVREEDAARFLEKGYTKPEEKKKPARRTTKKADKAAEAE